MPPRVTVYTPTWNRASTLPRVWKSLIAQTSQDFEWIVSDDGSNDGTIALLDGWQREAPFDMTIRSFPRRVGKPVLDNDGARAARGEYFIIADSDDEFVPHAVERFQQIWDSIPQAERSSFCIVNAQSICHDGTPVGVPFPKSPLDTTSFDLSYASKLHFDAWSCYRTAVVQENPHPEIDYYVPESIVWLHQLGRRYRVRCVNDVLRVMHRDSPNGITGTGRMRYNRGYAFGLSHVISNAEVRQYIRGPAAWLKNYINYGRLSHHGGVGFADAAGLLRPPGSRALFALAYPLARAAAWRDRRRDKVESLPYERFTGTPAVIPPSRGRRPT